MPRSTSRLSNLPSPRCRNCSTAATKESKTWSGGSPSSHLSDDQWRLIGMALGLSPRHLQIVRCIFDGLDEAAIGRELDISCCTVHAYMDRLHKKLRVRSRCDLIVRVFLAYLSGQAEEGAASPGVAEHAAVAHAAAPA